MTMQEPDTMHAIPQQQQNQQHMNPHKNEVENEPKDDEQQRPPFPVPVQIVTTAFGLVESPPNSSGANGTQDNMVYLDGIEGKMQNMAVSEGTDANGMAGTNGTPNPTTGEEVAGGEAEEAPVKLFVGQVPKVMNEEDIFPTFDKFGPLKDVAIIRDKHTGLHRGCAFVTYWSGADAVKAERTLHNSFTFQGGRRPVQVKPAEPSGEPENKLFIGMLSRKAGEDEVWELFERFGDIKEVYMIRSADGTSKCAAFLRYATRASALKAIESMHNNVTMEGATRPLIVKFADNRQQRQARQVRNFRRDVLMVTMSGGGAPGGVGGPQYPGFQPMPHMSQIPSPMTMPSSLHSQYAPSPYHPHTGFGSAGTCPPPPHPSVQPPHPHVHHPFMYPSPAPFGHIHPQAAAAMGYHGFPQQNPEVMRAPNPRPREGPAGANLFVYHLPHDLTDADLATAFNPFGNVISAKVYVDKYTGESKGFGFVSYDSVQSAEQAIEQMNGFQIGNKRLKVQHKRVNYNNQGHNNVGQQQQQQSSHQGDGSRGGQDYPE